MIRFLIPLSFFPALDHPPDFYPHKNLYLGMLVMNSPSWVSFQGSALSSWSSAVGLSMGCFCA